MSVTQVEAAILIERIMKIVTREDITAKSDSERLFQIRLLVIQYLDNN